MPEINYKMKYESLKLKFMSSVDEAYKLGYEQGMKDGQMEAMMQPQPGDEFGAEGQEGAPGEEGQGGMDQAGAPMGTELDQHIAQLEGMVGGGGDTDEGAPDATGESHGKKEKKDFSTEDKAKLKKSLDGIKAYRDAVVLHKNLLAIKKIGKALQPKPKLALSKQANANMSDSAKKAVSLQHDIVSDVMKSWAAEEERAAKSIVGILAAESLTKKE
jgi:hypothetical protein